MTPFFLLFLVLSVLCLSPCSASLSPGFRPPAIPLFILSPTIAVWLKADNITDKAPEHWIPQSMTMTGYVSIDNSAVYRFLGSDDPDSSFSMMMIEAMQQMAVVVQSTQTIVTLAAGGLRLTLTFTTASIPDDLTLYSRPYAYITISLTSIDGRSHTAQIYLDHGSDFPVNQLSEQVTWKDISADYPNNTAVLNISPYGNQPFDGKGDYYKPNWGRTYFATRSALLRQRTQASALKARQAFIGHQPLPPSDTDGPRPVNQGYLVSAFVFDYGDIGPNQTTSSFSVLAHDDVYSIDWFGQYQTPYWQQLYANTSDMIQDALHSYPLLMERCSAFDNGHVARMTRVAGSEYATITALVHRQVTGATVVTWNAERRLPWVFMKEQSSDGDVSTVDVVFPASPFYLLYGVETLRLIMLPILAYANNETSVHYSSPWAPHHLGTWPVCDILTNQQEDMPMEESSNMLILLATVAQRQGGRVEYLLPYTRLLDMWAQYIVSALPDPGNQLCTDDFEGPSPHNANLAVHGIIGLSAYAILLQYFGNQTGADYYNHLTQVFVADWLVLAKDPIPGLLHYKQRYDQNHTFSLKYNLVWQYVLGVEPFPINVRDTENTYYFSVANLYGLPLDNRKNLTKCDSSSWIAAMATTLQQQQQIIHWLYEFAHTSPNRVPYSDLYDTTANTIVGNFIARPVMGGLYNVAVVQQQQQQQQPQQQQTSTQQMQQQQAMAW